MEPIISAEALVKRYGDVTAVAGIDLAVYPGECFGLLGPNGAGKTSTIRMICCVSPITSGVLQVTGHDARRAPRAVKSRLGVVAQDDNLDDNLNVRQNLVVYTRYFNLPKDEARRRIDEALDLFQLGEKVDAGIYDLSGGMRRRLVIARALLSNPEILLLDEPTTGLDPQARLLVWEKINLLKQQGITVVLSTHYMEEATRLCDRVAIMYRGRIAAMGPPLKLIQEYAGEGGHLEDVFLRVTGHALVEE